MRLTVLASGSGGNSVLIEADRTRILIDAGLRPRELAARVERSATWSRLDDVQAVCVTHEHGDHASGVPGLAALGVAVYATGGTARAMDLAGTRAVTAGQTVEIGALQVTPVAVPHDAAEPVGYVVSDGIFRAGILTDCGYPSTEVAASFSGCDVLLLETNYDVHMLKTGAYPPFLKRRVGGALGHLSNDQAAELLRLMGPAPKVLILGHLSQRNNRPRLARQAIERSLGLGRLGPRPRVLMASQDQPLGPVISQAGRITVSPGEHDRQLHLEFPDGP